MSVESQILSQADHIAAVKAAFKASLSSRSSSALWTMVDAAADISYENRVKGSSITTIDTNVQNTAVGSLFTDWFRLHNEYFSQDAGISGVTNFKTAIEDGYRARVSQFFNDIFKANGGQGLALDNVFPRHDLVIGEYAVTGSAAGTYTDGDTYESTLSGPGQVGVYVVNQTVGGNDVDMSITCAFEDETTVAVAVTVPASSVVGTVVIVGEEDLTANHDADVDSGVVSVAATGQFKVGQSVILTDSNGVVEVATVLSISTNTSLTLAKIGSETAGLRNDFTTANSSKVVPLYTDVSAITNSDGTSGDDLELRFAPERAISLT